jgi:hypothetical protein
MLDTLTPPNVSAANAAINLEPPEPITRVEPERVDEMVTLSDDDRTELNERVRTFVEAVVTLDVHSDEFKSQIDAVHTMGSTEIREAAGVKTFPILFGSSNEEEMMTLGELTGGRTFDAHKLSLARVFKEIRGYQ